MALRSEHCACEETRWRTPHRQCWSVRWRQASCCATAPYAANDQRVRCPPSIPVGDCSGAVVHIRCRGKIPRTNADLMLERAIQRDRIEVPLAGDKGLVARGAKGLPPRRMLERLVLRNGLVCIKCGEARIEHRATGHTDRAGPSALLEAMHEGAARASKLVEIRRSHLPFHAGIQRTESKIVRNHKKSTFGRHSRPSRRCGSISMIALVVTNPD